MLSKLNNSKGIVMQTLIFIIAIIFLLTISAMFVINNQTIAISRTKTGEDALHIAEAGYNYYLWQLNDDSQFYRTGLDKDGKLIPINYYSIIDNPLWDGFPKEYEPVRYYSGEQLLGYYKLKIIPPSIEEAVVTIQSTGWIASIPDNKKTIEVKIRKNLFTNYITFLGNMSGVNEAKYLGDGEEIRGPFYTNETLRTNGSPIFHGSVSYVDRWDKSGSGNPVFKSGEPKRCSPWFSRKQMLSWPIGENQ